MSPKIKRKGKSFRAGKVQKKAKTDEWIEWIERASLWKRWAQRLSRLGLYTFACDAYVRYMSCLRRDRICLTPEEHVEIADVAHVTPVHVLSSNLLFRTCQSNTFHLKARFRLQSWYPHVYVVCLCVRARRFPSILSNTHQYSRTHINTLEHTSILSNTGTHVPRSWYDKIVQHLEFKPWFVARTHVTWSRP